MPSINRAPTSGPAAQQIASYYRDLIVTEELRPNARLPAAKDIAQEWSVSAVTVRAALEVLRGEGLIWSRQGQGVFVRPPVKRARRDAANGQILKDNVLLNDDERGKTGSAERDLGVALEELDFHASYFEEPPPADIAALLAISPSDLTLKRWYVTRYRDTGLLAQKSVEWIPRALLASNPRLLDVAEEPWPGGGMHQLFTVGIEIDRLDDVVTASMPSPDEQGEWGLAPGIPMLRTRCVYYDTESRPAVVSDASYPADRTELAFSTQLRRWEPSTPERQAP